jgi:hypothetical protein
MMRTFVFALPVLLLSASWAGAQSPSSGDDSAGQSRTLRGSQSPRFLRPSPSPATSTRLQELRTGRLTNEAAADLLASPEYYQRSGGTDASFVQRFYLDILGRYPTPVEMNYWMGRLRNETRGAAMQCLLRLHPQTGSAVEIAPVRYLVPPQYNPRYFPDPASETFPDPSGPYFHDPYLGNYERSPAIRAFSLRSQG